jgi:hypothetical protein
MYKKWGAALNNRGITNKENKGKPRIKNKSY